MSLVKLTTCNTSFDANLIKAHLESEEIPCYIYNEILNSVMPYFNTMTEGSIQVMIDEENLEQAINIMEQINESLPEEEEVVSCPKCSSKDTSLIFKQKGLLRLFILLFNSKYDDYDNYRCLTCNTKFKIAINETL